MHTCRNPEHPHCTQWVMQGTDACPAGHAQEAAEPPAGAACPPTQAVPASDPGAGPHGSAPPLSVRTECRALASYQPERRAQVSSHPRPTLHVSGFDPRAAGGRQALRLELRGMPRELPAHLAMHLKSALLAPGFTQREFARTRHGEWPSTVIEFSSRGREHGQYPIEVELLAPRHNAPPRRWTCTLVILVPRADATLTEIHQTFLATHKNVRVVADDGSIARLGANTGGGQIDIDLTARNASIAQLNLDGNGKADLALPSIAWDEDLIETGTMTATHPQPLQAACIVNPESATGEARHVRLFALEECVLGRLDTIAPIADVLLAHYGQRGPDSAGLTRRLSAQHAILRAGQYGFEIEDISRYGILVDGAWPGRHVPVALRPGMRIELTASIRSVVTLEVTAVMAHGIVLHRVDAGQAAECFCFLAPGRRPEAVLHSAYPRAAGLPVIFHVQGGFWHLDHASGRETPLCDGARCGSLGGIQAYARFAATPYPDLDQQPPPLRPGSLRRLRARDNLASA